MTESAKHCHVHRFQESCGQYSSLPFSKQWGSLGSNFVFIPIEEQITLGGVNEHLDIWLQRIEIQIKNIKSSSYSELSLSCWKTCFL